MDEKTRTELEAAVYRRLVEHLRSRTDVQNIDMMNLAGFCRNCLSNWMKDAADAKGISMSKDESREIVYGILSMNGARNTRRKRHRSRKRHSKSPDRATRTHRWHVNSVDDGVLSLT